MDDWINKNLEYPTFQYWHTTEFELLFFTFMRSYEKETSKYIIESLISLAPWRFALDRTQNTLQPLVTCTFKRYNSFYIFQEFQNGNFVIRNSIRKFQQFLSTKLTSKIILLLIGDGGAVGLFDRNETLERWSTSGPEVMRMLNEFRENELKCHVSSILHHDQIKSTQCLFVADVYR